MKLVSNPGRERVGVVMLSPCSVLEAQEVEIFKAAFAQIDAPMWLNAAQTSPVVSCLVLTNELAHKSAGHYECHFTMREWQQNLRE